MSLSSQSNGSTLTFLFSNSFSSTLCRIEGRTEGTSVMVTEHAPSIAVVKEGNDFPAPSSMNFLLMRESCFLRNCFSMYFERINEASQSVVEVLMVCDSLLAQDDEYKYTVQLL